MSKWVQTILQHPGDSPEHPYILKTAFTGTAASNIGGLTLTSTFKFGYGNEFTAMKDKERDEICASQFAIIFSIMKVA